MLLHVDFNSIRKITKIQFKEYEWIMKLKRKEFSGLLSMVICLSLLGNIPLYAAGKTVEAFKK